MGVYGLVSPRIPIFSPYKYHGAPLLGVHPIVPWYPKFKDLSPNFVPPKDPSKHVRIESGISLRSNPMTWDWIFRPSMLLETGWVWSLRATATKLGKTARSPGLKVSILSQVHYEKKTLKSKGLSGYKGLRKVCQEKPHIPSWNPDWFMTGSWIFMA